MLYIVWFALIEKFVISYNIQYCYNKYQDCGIRFDSFILTISVSPLLLLIP